MLCSFQSVLNMLPSFEQLGMFVFLCPLAPHLTLAKPKSGFLKPSVHTIDII